MWLKCTRSLLAACGLLLLMAMPASAQGLGDMQLFAPAQMNEFGGGPKPAQGWFFSYDALYWHIQQPKAAVIGAPDGAAVVDEVREVPLESAPFYHGYGATGTTYTIQQHTEVSTSDTSNFSAGAEWGNRYEIGWMDDHQGLMVSASFLTKHTEVAQHNEAGVYFKDPVDSYGNRCLTGILIARDYHWDPYGSDYPDLLYNVDYIQIDAYVGTYFETMEVKYAVRTWSIELDYLSRSEPFHYGGVAELLLGVRYMEFDDAFSVAGAGERSLGNSWWANTSQNHLFGPQIGLRYFKKKENWMLNAEGRAMAALNTQSIHQEAKIQVTGADWPGAFINHAAFQPRFTPLVELRLELRYQFTKAISGHVGWNGIWMTNIARSPGMIEYTLPSLGINGTHTRDSVLMQGLTFGFDFNR